MLFRKLLFLICTFCFIQAPNSALAWFGDEDDSPCTSIGDKTPIRIKKIVCLNEENCFKCHREESGLDPYTKCSGAGNETLRDTSGANKEWLELMVSEILDM